MDILDYTYPQFYAFLKAIEKKWSYELSDLVWAGYVGHHADNKKLQEILYTLRG